MGPIVAVLDDQILLRQPLQNGHDRGVGEVALGSECFVYLAHGLGLVRRPQVVHHGPLQLPEPCHLGHLPFISYRL